MKFRLRVLPMGWSWAVWVMQNILEHLVGTEGPRTSQLAMHRPTPPISAEHSAQVLYIDNFAVVGESAEAAEQEVQGMLDKLQVVGVAAAASTKWLHSD